MKVKGHLLSFFCGTNQFWPFLFDGVGRGFFCCFSLFLNIPGLYCVGDIITFLSFLTLCGPAAVGSILRILSYVQDVCRRD